MAQERREIPLHSVCLASRLNKSTVQVFSGTPHFTASLIRMPSHGSPLPQVSSNASCDFLVLFDAEERLPLHPVPEHKPPAQEQPRFGNATHGSSEETRRVLHSDPSWEVSYELTLHVLHLMLPVGKGKGGKA